MERKVDSAIAEAIQALKFGKDQMEQPIDKIKASAEQSIPRTPRRTTTAELVRGQRNFISIQKANAIPPALA